MLLLSAALVRLALLPLSHTWDGQTWLNTFAQLTAGGGFLETLRRPYETMRELSLLTAAAGRHTDFYEGWAYPPLMLYVYWPLAHLYTALFGTVQPTYPVQPSFFASSVPISLSLFVRVPNIAADLAGLAIMRRLGVGLRELRWYAFNPLVLLVCLWTFDSVMVLFLLLALLLAERRHWGWSGAALALGGATKLVPLLALPALIVGILVDPGPGTSCHAERRAKHLLPTPPRDPSLDAQSDTGQQGWLRSTVRVTHLVGSTLLAVAATLAILIWPVRDGMLYVLRFHTDRFAQGMTFEELWRTWSQQLPNTDWQPRWQLYASSTVGDLVLPLAVLAACWLILQRPLALRTSMLLLMLAFVAGSKLVNESYALAPLALLTVELAHNPSQLLRDCRLLLWVTAFAYAMVNMPLWSLAFSTAQQIAPASRGAIQAITAAYRDFLSYPESMWVFAVLGSAFTAVAVLTAFVAWHGGELGREKWELGMAAA